MMAARPLTKVIINPVGRHTSTVVFLHGLGDTGEGWAPVAREIAPLFPHTKFILPNAPIQPVTLNMGMKMPSWYDIVSLSSLEEHEDEKGLTESSRSVTSIIREEVDNGIPASRIVLGGFSQGGAVTCFTGLTTEYKLAGFIMLSTYLPLRTKIGRMESNVNKKTPILMCHGEADPVVQFAYGMNSHLRLKELGYNVTFKSYRGMGHSSSPQELRDMVEFLKQVLPEDATAASASV
ncbi:uncharacterized protein VTP21DRAFT_3871 [Calcarisporiella thermophila]|uniref:uncharacterized protein n=1 Tax=Calcarisporiella thermophila TaxID=911321 RepID=UPI0037429258